MALLFRLRSTDRVYNATTGTTAASNGGAVGSWEPMAGLITTRALHASKGPTYRSNDNSSGFPGLEWSAGKLLTMAHTSDWVGWTSFSWLAVVRNMTANSSQNRYLWSRSNSSAWASAGCRFNSAVYSDTIITMHDGVYTGRRASMSQPTESTSTRYVIAGTCNATEIKLYGSNQIRVPKSYSQSPVLGTSGLIIGEDTDGAGTYNLSQGVLFELAFWNAELSESDMATEIATAKTTWSATDTVTIPSSGGGILVPLGMGGGFGG